MSGGLWADRQGCSTSSPLPVNEAFSGRATIPPFFRSREGPRVALKGSGHPGVGKNFPPSSVRDLGLGWPLGKSFASGSGGGGGVVGLPTLEVRDPFLSGCLPCSRRSDQLGTLQTIHRRAVSGWVWWLKGEGFRPFPPSLLEAGRILDV